MKTNTFTAAIALVSAGCGAIMGASYQKTNWYSPKRYRMIAEFEAFDLDKLEIFDRQHITYGPGINEKMALVQIWSVKDDDKK